MSSRLIALMLLLIAHPAMAQTETTTEATDQAAEVVEQEVTQAAESASDVVTESVDTAETAAENAEQAVQDVAEDSAAQVEEMADEATATATEASQEVVEEVAETAEEAEAVVEETAEQAQAADEATESAEAATEGDQQATETAMAADSGVEAKLAACAACHGADGNSVIPQNPKLAGQVPGFIADQLAKFKSGERNNAIMAAQVANLTEEDMLAMDAFYAAQQPQLGAVSEDMQELAEQGEEIYRGGEPSMSISACMSCHGPSGDGIPTRFPRVGGQHIEYLEQQLLAYKSGDRVSEVMYPIAFRLSEQQIKALAAYMHALK